MPASGRFFHGAYQGLEPACVGHGIVVEGRQIGCGGRAEALVEWPLRNRPFRLFSMTRAFHPAAGAPHQTLPAVVHDDHFKIAPCLLPERIHALLKPRIRSQGGDHHRYEEIRQSQFYQFAHSLIDEATLPP